MKSKSNMMLDYMYRDGSNYKRGGYVVFNGCPEDLAAYESELRRLLDKSEYFIADQIGVPEVFIWLEPDRRIESDDHCWHEFCGVEELAAEPTDSLQRTPAQFLRDVAKASESGWRVFDPAARDKKSQL